MYTMQLLQQILVFLGPSRGLARFAGLNLINHGHHERTSAEPKKTSKAQCRFKLSLWLCLKTVTRSNCVTQTHTLQKRHYCAHPWSQALFASPHLVSAPTGTFSSPNKQQSSRQLKLSLTE